jgi:hypothetical protein
VVVVGMQGKSGLNEIARKTRGELGKPCISKLCFARLHNADVVRTLTEATLQAGGVQQSKSREVVFGDGQRRWVLDIRPPSEQLAGAPSEQLATRGCLRKPRV